MAVQASIAVVGRPARFLAELRFATLVIFGEDVVCIVRPSKEHFYAL